MAIDTVIYETDTESACLAGLTNGRLSEIEFINRKKASEGNVYLAKIVQKLDLANDKVGYLIDINDTKLAFLNAWEFGLEELKATEGQSLIAQVVQEQRAEKGAKLSRNLQFAGTNLVYCPYKMNVDVSSKIDDKIKAEECKEWVVENTTGQEGWIVRTSAVLSSKEEILQEMENLRVEYEDVRKKARSESAPCLLKEKGNPLWEMINRNKKEVKKIVTNSRLVGDEIHAVYGDLFEVVLDNNPSKTYGIEESLAEAMLAEVNLPSGGRIFIQETKAFVAIDVDSAGDKAKGNISRLNEEAAEEIIRQIRLRNLSGKIIIDFAGATEYRYLSSVIEKLEKAFKGDYIRTTVYGLSKAGNVEIVRARRRPSLQDVLSQECTTCGGTGRVEA